MIRSLTLPRPGTVVTFGYLWRDEAKAGHDRPLKGRPCLVMGVRCKDGVVQAALVAITHTPQMDDAMLEMPGSFQKAAGLDGATNYVVVGECNLVTWPAGDQPPMTAIGQVPLGFFSDVQKGLLRVRDQQRLRVVDRGHVRARAPRRSRSR